jgi:tetratricopeptide (TPR) repeat protein
VRYSLPADTAAFSGRGKVLEQITAVVAGLAEVSGVVAVAAIDGMPGVGKTALAIHVAHSLASKFPDRQLFIDLHAHTPGHEPMRPEDALAGLLAAVGVDPRYLPRDPGGRAALWRDRMAGQRAVLVLDNAASTGQVGPLLPGGDGHLVLVTSRRHLGDLPGAVTRVLLDALPPSDAADMFTRLAPRAAGDRDGVEDVVRMAGRLPLAVSLLARVFTRHPSWTLADLATDTRAKMLTIAAEHDSIATAFEVSYRHLAAAARRLFRLLGMHPGTTVDEYAAAALAGTGLADAAGLLDGLHREGLVTEAGRRRYGMHDLLRRYARELAVADPAESEQALGRLLDYYQHTAALAETRLARLTRPGTAAPCVPAGCEIPELADAGQALAWARADRANLLACLDLVERTGQHARVVALTAVLAVLLRREGPWAEAVTRHAAAAGAARHIGDRLGEANALHDLGDVRQLVGDYPAAAQSMEQALGAYRDLGSRLGEANALKNLGDVRRLTGDYPGAARAYEQAMGIFCDLGERLGEARALNELGVVRRQTGDYPGAARVSEQALGICRDLGDRLGEARALSNLGTVRYLTGGYPAAAGILEQALAVYRDLGDRLGEANALSYLGVVRRMTGDFSGAARAHEEALGICRDLGSRPGEANNLNELGAVRCLTGDYPGAAGLVEQALGINRDVGDRLGEAETLSNLGKVRQATGDYPGAAQALDQALGIFRDLGDQQGQAETLNERGTLHRARGDLAHAQQFHQQALNLARLTGSTRDEAVALAGLGRCAIAAGHAAQAEALLRQAHEIFQRTGAAEAGNILSG